MKERMRKMGGNASSTTNCKSSLIVKSIKFDTELAVTCCRTRRPNFLNDLSHFLIMFKKIVYIIMKSILRHDDGREGASRGSGDRWNYSC